MGARLGRAVRRLEIRIHLAPPWPSTVPTKSPSQWEQLRNQRQRPVLASVESEALLLSPTVRMNKQDWPRHTQEQSRKPERVGGARGPTSTI